MALSNRQRLAAQRLTAAVLLPRLMVQIKGEPLAAGDDPALLADLLILLEADPEWATLGKALLEERSGLSRTPHFAALWSAILKRLPSRGHHHLALLYCRWGWDALGNVSDTGPAPVRTQWTRATTHIARVLDDPAFFAELGGSCGAPDLSEALHAQAAELWLTPHTKAMLGGLHPEIAFNRDILKSHWTVLTRTSNPNSKISEATASRLRTASEVCQRKVFDHVLYHARQLAADVESTNATLEHLRRPFAFASAFTDIAGPHESFTIWAIELCIEWSWTLYKSDDMKRLRALIEVCEPFGLHLERLLRSKTGAFGRQSKCATYLLFMADFETGDQEELLLERALQVCPGHRNSRLMLSYSRLKKANAELAKVENADLVTRYLSASAIKGHIERAGVLIADAEELYPGNEKLIVYRERLENVRKAQER